MVLSRAVNNTLLTIIRHLLISAVVPIAAFYLFIYFGINRSTYFYVMQADIWCGDDRGALITHRKSRGFLEDINMFSLILFLLLIIKIQGDLF